MASAFVEKKSREPGESEKGVLAAGVRTTGVRSGVTLEPASAAASVAASVSPITVANPATPPEALQAPISEEEARYRKELRERLAKLSDEVPKSEKKKRPEK